MEKLKDIIKEGVIALGLATAVGVGIGTFLISGSKNYVKQIREEIPSYSLIEDRYSIDDEEREDIEYKEINGQLYRFDKKNERITPLVLDYGW